MLNACTDHFFQNFEMKGRFGTGQESLKTSVSSPCFFSSGRTIACLKDDGTDDSAKGLLIIIIIIIIVTTGKIMSLTNLRILVGMGSNSNDLEAELNNKLIHIFLKHLEILVIM